MKLLSSLASSLLLSQATAWSIYLQKYGCNEPSNHQGKLLEDNDNNNHECLTLPDDIATYPAFGFHRAVGRCHFSFSTSADNCANKVYTNTYDANYERGCFRVKQDWQYLTVTGCDHHDVPPV
ncbi:hypothetical protein NLG97_g4613 [Lecanicillium saksenae]|uniref:Uncharacterized protein n=1 Tax=Lecanicillium saksenae TaxID=468837 RepID=A0ACC1QW46_9HYPO|nr:hypothetical protein NLG97_g4613 [Lecanicillium saksenae]